MDNELNRREFIRLTLMSSAMLMGKSPVLQAKGMNSASPAHGALRSLAPGAVQPEGWLRGYLEKQARLCSALPRTSWPFTEAYWAGMEDADAWWPWEQEAYWIDGATRLSLVLQDEGLMAQVRNRIDYTLSHAGPNGYLG